MYTLEKMEKWKDADGKIVYKYFEGQSKQWISVFLKKGCVAGHHYHKGTQEVKNPEIGVVLTGKLKYKLKHVETNETEDVIVEAPSIIKIYPFVYHEVEAMEDSLFIEPFDGGGKDIDRWEL